MTKSQKFENEIISFNNKLASEVGKFVFTNCSIEIEHLSDSGLSSIRDIMIQLMRNVVIHGIESPHHRIECGKFKQGAVTISIEKDSTSYHTTGEPAYICDVRDDGRGLDAGKIKARALELEMITEEEFDTLSKPDLIKLIFQPNFSTVDELSPHAGRGVGMDLIKDLIINEFEGKISVSYTPNVFMQISFMIPARTIENERIILASTA